MSQDLLALSEHWGYFLLPPAHPTSPGGSGLYVFMHAKPTQRHFDPEQITCYALGAQGLPEQRKLGREAVPQMSLTVCLGDIELRDRVGKTEEFFTFGGSLEAIVRPEQTTYIFESPAPVLRLLPDFECLPDAFVSEVEVEIHSLRARWGNREKEFDRRLASIDPQTLYSALIQSLWKKYADSPALQHACHDLYRMLAGEDARLQNGALSSEPNPSLEDLFAL